MIDIKIKKQFRNTFKFSNNDINKFILLLRKGIYPYEYMDDWKKFNETLHKKEDFYGNVNIEEIIDSDYSHAKRVWKDFEKKNWVNIMIFIKAIHYNWLMFSKTLQKCVEKFMN